MGINGSPYEDDTPPALTGGGGDGPTEIGVLSERGKVILRFPKPMLWVAFDVTGARNVADAMTAEADRIKRLLTPAERSKYAATRLRNKLITRVTLMLTSMERDRKKPAYQAAHVVDQVLQAVQELASR